MLRLLSASPDQTHAIAVAIANHLVGGELLTLEGPLGSGKTAFVRGLAQGLSINPSLVSSPTFVIHHRYPAPLSLTLHHIDAYRLTSPEDLATIGFDELLSQNDSSSSLPQTAAESRSEGSSNFKRKVNSGGGGGSEGEEEEEQRGGGGGGEEGGSEGGVIIIEWPSRIASAIPRDHLAITFDHLSPTDRLLTLTASGSHIPLLEILAPDLAPHLASQSALCRTCSATITTDSPHFPFCSNRCRLADLNAWFTGKHLLSRPIHADEELSD